ncbi:MAG TPA: ATP-dependent DNA helicase RecG [Gammaproteobacteria bacterium]
MPQTDSAATLPVTSLKGIGPAAAKKLERLGLRTVQDLLFHLPFRYQDRTRIVPIGTLRPGDQAVVEGEVQLTEVKFGKRRMLLSRISDGTGSITLRFFHFNAAQQANLARGTRLRCFGEVRTGSVTLEMVHPEYRRIDHDAPVAVEEHLTPLYPASEGVHQQSLRQPISRALDLLTADTALLHDWLPETLRDALQMPSLHEALFYLHRPPPDAPQALLAEGLHPAQRRLAFEELLAHHLSLQRLRQRRQQKRAFPLAGDGSLTGQLLATLPFALTAAQQRVVSEVSTDLKQPHPMQRLVQGDVGSGKTIVAALAVLQAVESGYQAAVMAPTELLAEQHYRNFAQWLSPLGVELAWLAGKVKGKGRGAMVEALATGSARVAIGTHALFQKEVSFARLGLVIIDEQHRFGVHQRLALRDKGMSNGVYPHQLIMTATPIPRTLQMTAYADLDVSLIDQLPPGRTPVETVAMAEAKRGQVVAHVLHACQQGRQAYWVCTLIEESEALQCQAAEESAALLREALPGLRIGLVHGRLKPAEKETVMAQFKAHQLDLLVATTVIEVGVDVPNASLMIIENAERLGLAQLHQLRGRVGRGAAKSSCVLLYKPPLSETARKRLQVMRESNDGFLIARTDLALRGPGELLGTRQSGAWQLRIADLLRDEELLPQVAVVAEEMLELQSASIAPLIARWLHKGERLGEV